MGSRWAVNRTVAQVHALLYLAGKPLAAEEIAESLSVAQSNEPQIRVRIAAMHDFPAETHTWYRQMAKLPPATLRRLMSLGTGLTRCLPRAGLGLA